MNWRMIGTLSSSGTHPTQLQDQFAEEFIKWGFEHCVDRIDIHVLCISPQDGGNHYHVVLCDEIHLGFSPVYRQFFEHNTYDRLLCMTATIPEIHSIVRCWST